MEKWVVTAKKADFQGISRKYGIDPVIARIIRNRDITTDEDINQYLNGTLSDIPSWKLLKGYRQGSGNHFRKNRSGNQNEDHRGLRH